MEISATLVLAVLTVAISLYAWSNPDFLESWIMEPYRMKRQNDWYRFLTSGFLHADFTHLLFNMIAFYSFSRVVETIFGYAFGPTAGLLWYLLLYLGGIVVSSVPTYLRHRDDPNYRSLGASGGVSAVVFSAILFNPAAGLYIFPLPFEIPGFIFGFLYLGYSYYMSQRQGDNINHDAHFYGALYGVVLTLLLIPRAAVIFLEQIQGYIGKYL
ncbi:rhomboid family intramembrane serine protease [Hymenobacter actinosclerus]|uniref:Membrane associated serine protease, rhomboid family n=1 Tax=Hymenobacter actinosclerus TaxID=82805 RepID=A0A1I0IY94_9BACT|nr:rhomboid family intramembrane serine protease [Hymenobacter actinosclerus]SEU02132.1 Membrane associated serine protease, rhomboid family [Hymenobacter actinosclerus]